MNIDELTIGQAKSLASMFSTQSRTGLNSMVGSKAIIRTYSAGVWFGVVSKKSGDEVILTNARRMWRWWAEQGISLSGCAIYGVKHDKSKIVAPVDSVWLQAIEIIPCTDASISSIEGAPHADPE